MFETMCRACLIAYFVLVMVFGVLFYQLHTSINRLEADNAVIEARASQQYDAIQQEAIEQQKFMTKVIVATAQREARAAIQEHFDDTP